jgi:hypothetical protein
MNDDIRDRVVDEIGQLHAEMPEAPTWSDLGVQVVERRSGVTMRPWVALASAFVGVMLAIGAVSLLSGDGSPAGRVTLPDDLASPVAGSTTTTAAFPESVDPTILGACTGRDSAALYPLSFFASARSWVEVSEFGTIDTSPVLEHPELVDDPSRFVAVDVPNATVIVARHHGVEDRRTLYPDADVLALAQPERADGNRVMFSVDAFGRSSIAVSLRLDGSVVFVGECAARYTTELVDAVAAANEEGANREVVEFWHALLDNPSGPEWTIMAGLLDPDSWFAQSADIRSLNYVDAPAGVLAENREVLVVLDVPQAWKTSDDAVVCPRISIGWSVCSPFSRTLVDLPPVVAAGQPLELWLMESFGEYSNAFGLIGAIDPQLVLDAFFGVEDDVAILIEVSTTGNGNTLDSIAEDVALGRVTISTRLIDYRKLVDDLAAPQDGA